MWEVVPELLENPTLCAAKMSVPMSVNVGSGGARTCGKAQVLVPISYDMGFLRHWALGPGPLRASIGKS
eukprot:8948420-Karenia_brevis.AAC.1